MRRRRERQDERPKPEDASGPDAKKLSVIRGLMNEYDRLDEDVRMMIATEEFLTEDVMKALQQGHSNADAIRIVCREWQRQREARKKYV